MIFTNSEPFRILTLYKEEILFIEGHHDDAFIISSCAETFYDNTAFQLLLEKNSQIKIKIAES